jgi:putative flippase GtrA
VDGVKLPPVVWFVMVGTLAAAVHWCVVRALVSAAVLSPLAANLPAWCVAFGVSYSGHRWLTFAHQGSPLRRSAARFALLSLGGLALNEAAYAALLHLTPLRYDLALAVVLLAVAVVTYLLGRHWAFEGRRP